MSMQAEESSRIGNIEAWMSTKLIEFLSHLGVNKQNLVLFAGRYCAFRSAALKANMSPAGFAMLIKCNVFFAEHLKFALETGFASMVLGPEDMIIVKKCFGHLQAERPLLDFRMENESNHSLLEEATQVAEILREMLKEEQNQTVSQRDESKESNTMEDVLRGLRRLKTDLARPVTQPVNAPYEETHSPSCRCADCVDLRLMAEFSEQQNRRLDTLRKRQRESFTTIHTFANTTLAEQQRVLAEEGRGVRAFFQAENERMFDFMANLGKEQAAFAERMRNGKK